MKRILAIVIELLLLWFSGVYSDPFPIYSDQGPVDCTNCPPINSTNLFNGRLDHPDEKEDLIYFKPTFQFEKTKDGCWKTKIMCENKGKMLVLAIGDYDFINQQTSIRRDVINWYGICSADGYWETVTNSEGMVQFSLAACAYFNV